MSEDWASVGPAIPTALINMFDASRTVEMVAEIGAINGKLEQAGRKYLLIGPGRWGSADRWLGIPVTWRHIAGVDSIVETSVKNLQADPSQGSHFFHNITSLGIGYITVRPAAGDTIDWQWLDGLPTVEETRHVRHVCGLAEDRGPREKEGHLYVKNNEQQRDYVEAQVELDVRGTNRRLAALIGLLLLLCGIRRAEKTPNQQAYKQKSQPYCGKQRQVGDNSQRRSVGR